MVVFNLGGSDNSPSLISPLCLVMWRPRTLDNILAKVEIKPGLSFPMKVKLYLVRAKMGEPGEVCFGLVEVGAEGVSLWSIDPRAQARSLSMKGRVCGASSLRSQHLGRSHTWLFFDELVVVLGLGVITDFGRAASWRVPPNSILRDNTSIRLRKED